MHIPSDYKLGYEKARAVAPDIADQYVAHTLIGDPLAEAMTEDLAEFTLEESGRFIQGAMDQEGEEALRDAPASLRRFFKEAETPPEWLDYSAFAPGVRMFHRNSQMILAAFVPGVLIEGFTTNIAKSFFIEEALKLYDIGLMCEPKSPVESVAMAHSLVNSAPLIAGRTDPADRRDLANYAYRVSRGLIGDEIADSLMYPPLSAFGVVWWFKAQNRYGNVLEKLFPVRRRNSNFARFTSLLDTSLFDEEGIRYTLPDHVYAEESTKW